MKNILFKRWFLELTGHEFPLTLPDCFLLSNNDAFWTPANTLKFKLEGLPYRLLISNYPEPYRAFGYWGYGLNSYAFYTTRIEDRIKIIQRTPYGGVFFSSDPHAKHLIEVIAKAENVATYLKRFCSVSITENMGDFTIKLSVEARSVELRGEHSPEFWTRVVAMGENL